MEAIMTRTYREYVSIEKNVNKILYLQPQKALYGCLHNTLLLYIKLNDEIKYFGFLSNP